MKVKMRDNTVLNCNASYAARLIEQGKATMLKDKEQKKKKEPAKEEA